MDACFPESWWSPLLIKKDESLLVDRWIGGWIGKKDGSRRTEGKMIGFDDRNWQCRHFATHVSVGTHDTRVAV